MPTFRFQKSLRFKTILFAGGVLLALVILIGTLTSSQLLSTFAKLQRFLIEQQIERFVVQLEKLGEMKVLLVKEYAEWDETHNFLTGSNPDYLSHYFEPGQNTTGEDLLVLFNLQQSVVATRWIKAESDRDMPLADSKVKAIREGNLLQKGQTLGLIAEKDPLLLAAAPILHTDQTGPAAGWLVYGRKITKEMLNEIIDLVGVRCSGVRVVDSSSLPALNQEPMNSRTGLGELHPQIYLTEKTPSKYDALLVFPVLGSNEVVCIDLKIQMQVLDAAIEARNNIIILAVIGGLCLVALPLLAFEVAVLRKLAKLDREIQALSEKEGGTDHLAAAGPDEFGRLASSVNRLIDSERAASERLNQQRNLLEGIINAALEGIYVLEPVRDEKGKITDLRFTLCNTSTEKIIGREPGAMVGRTLIEEFPAIAGSRLLDKYIQVVETGVPAKFEYQATGNYQYRWFGVSITPWNSGVVVTLDDITTTKTRESELNEAKEEAEKANRAKSDFLTTMSHEIRTPLNGVIGFTTLLANQNLGAEEKDLVSNIQDSSKLLLALVTDVLDFSQIEAGRMTLDPKPLALADLVERIARAAALPAREKGLEFNYQTDPSVPPVVVADAIRIEQVLGNLLSNALKFTDSGRIDLEVTAGDQPSHSSREVIFRVRDTGVGISKAQQERLFTPFTQANSSLSRRHGGSGLGLVIIRRLCEMMGGGVVMESTEGKGSTVTATIVVGLPREHVTLETPAVSIAFDDIKVSPGLRVLVAEDNRLNQRLMDRMLLGHGCVTQLVPDGREAVELATQQEFDLILMDVSMPDMDGLTATRFLRSRENDLGSRRRFIVALTAGVSEDEKQKCMEAGMDDFLGKPFSEEALISILRRAK